MADSNKARDINHATRLEIAREHGPFVGSWSFTRRVSLGGGGRRGFLQLRTK